MAMGLHEQICSDGIGHIGITLNGNPLAILDGLSATACMARHMHALFLTSSMVTSESGRLE